MDNRLKYTVKNIVRKILKEETERYNTTEEIINYIRSFGQKGKLQSNSKPISEYYKPFIQQAYEMIKKDEPNSEVVYNGFPWFEREFRINVLGKLTTNKRGLIYVEREIEVQGDLNNLNFSSVGECWTFGRYGSKSYASNYGIMSKTTRITLCGYVHPSSINWLATCYLNGWELKNEEEIRMGDEAIVELNYIRINGNKQTIGGTYLIDASANNYKNKWE